jgi:RimJ/RimL family protein N-acetyltransferase
MLTGEKVILRPIRFEDWEKTVKWRNDLFIKVSTMSHPFPITIEMEKKWYEENLNNKNNTFLPFTVQEKENGNVLGYFSLNNINWISRNGFVSGAIGEKSNIGKGYGREAVTLLLDYAFNFLNLNKVCAYVVSDHPALKTWESLGARIEGKLHKHYFAKGNYLDVVILAWFPNMK